MPSFRRETDTSQKSRFCGATPSRSDVSPVPRIGVIFFLFLCASIQFLLGFFKSLALSAKLAVDLAPGVGDVTNLSPSWAAVEEAASSSAGKAEAASFNAAKVEAASFGAVEAGAALFCAVETKVMSLDVGKVGLAFIGAGETEAASFDVCKVDAALLDAGGSVTASINAGEATLLALNSLERCCGADAVGVPRKGADDDANNNVG